MNKISNVSNRKRKRNEENNVPIDGERNKCAKKSNYSLLRTPKISTCVSVAPLRVVTRSKTRVLTESNPNAKKNQSKIDEEQAKNNNIENKWKFCAPGKSSKISGPSSDSSSTVLEIKRAISILTEKAEQKNKNFVPLPSTVTRSKARALAESNSNVPNSEMLVDKKRKKKQKIRVNDNADSSTTTQNSNSANEKTASVKIGDLVWSKLTGWPYWPSTVESIMPDGMIRVRFIEKKSRYADVKIANIVKFEEGCFEKRIKADVQKNATLKKCVKDAITKLVVLDLMKSPYDQN